MLSFTPAGRFGNWYMECCTMLSYALKHNLEFTVPTPHGKDPYWNPVYCLHLVNENWNPDLETIHLWESKHTYEELPFEESWRDKNIIIEGYRQSSRYFQEHTPEIRYLLGFPYEKKEGYVSIHYRDGDYKILADKHPEIPLSYFEEAVKMFPDYKFKVFSDNIPFCKDFFASFPEFEYSSNTDEVSDFIEMQNCEHHINSSSTFSWASAWHNRNPDKIVVTPKLWFVDGYHLDTSDIIPENWIKL